MRRLIVQQIQEEKPLKFIVAPHIVEDLGLNLYTDLPRVLVEFIANAYDADATFVNIEIDFEGIKQARTATKAAWKQERKSDVPLAARTLPNEVKITVTDDGHGMSRDELQAKFLIAGRRRREEEKSSTSKGGRIVMGRKGLGKLAGFGIAHGIEVVSKKEDLKTGTKIFLNYDDLRKQRKDNSDVIIKDENVEHDQDIPLKGTKIIMSNLVYEPLKSQDATIIRTISEYFRSIKPEEFKIKINGKEITPIAREFAYAYPPIANETFDHLITHTLQSEDDEQFSFKYRIRFTKPKEHLNAKERGVRVYAHKRIASAPDLLDLPTGIHGFRLVHYLDGVAEADFIDDDQHIDYISTDRQTLRWDTSKLSTLRAFLTDQMKLACDAYQKQKDKESENEIEKDEFTNNLIKQEQLPPYKRRLAKKISAALLAHSGNDITSPEFQRDVEILVRGLGKGELLTALGNLAAANKPNFTELQLEIQTLTFSELEEFSRIVEGRVLAIEALKKLVIDRDFSKSNNEEALFRLLKGSPWLIDPKFSKVFTANQSKSTMFDLIRKDLQIEQFVEDEYDKEEASENSPYEMNRRPDLVFMMGSDTNHEIVIVELKAPNTPLHHEHLVQLNDYIRTVEEWLKNNKKTHITVKGLLIGSIAAPNDNNTKVLRLRHEIDKNKTKESWAVVDLLELVESNVQIHQEMLDSINLQLVESTM